MDAEGERTEDTYGVACPAACRRETRGRREVGNNRPWVNRASFRPAARGVRASSFDGLDDPDAAGPDSLGSSHYGRCQGPEERHPG